jgi:hypothetical protein
MACVPACPSGVRYDRLIEQVRPQLERNAPRSPAERRFRKAVFALFTHPGRLRVVVPALAADRWLGVGRGLGRDLQPHPAGGGEEAGPVQGREPDGDRGRGDRGREPGLRVADHRIPHRPVPVYHPMTLLDASIRGVRP